MEYLSRVLKDFDKIYYQMTDLEKKEFMRNFIESIEILPERTESGRILKHIDLRFPIYYKGSEGDQIRLLNEMNVETVCLLSREKVDGYIDIDLDVESIENKGGRATYVEIKQYVKEKYGLTISSLNIAQIKDKVGMEKRLNYNLGSGEGRVPNCPPEKEETIMDAFRYFSLI